MTRQEWAFAELDHRRAEDARFPDQGRWNMFNKDVPPIAWMPWPEHPGVSA